jgi:hypothetical protein
MNTDTPEPTYIALKVLASELGMDRSHARRYVLNLGITPLKRRTADSGGQLTLTVSNAEANLIRRTRTEQGFTGSQTPVENEVGFFYFIQLVPEFAPTRIKLGFADNVTNRLQQHRTSAPTATVVKHWPCRRSWERTAIDAIASAGGALILNEVFDFQNLEAAIQRADQFFSLLPKPSSKHEVAEHSPHRQHNDMV